MFSISYRLLINLLIINSRKMKILYNDSIKHGKNSTLEIKLECSYMVSGMMERGWGKASFPKGGKCSILI